MESFGYEYKGYPQMYGKHIGFYRGGVLIHQFSDVWNTFQDDETLQAYQEARKDPDD